MKTSPDFAYRILSPPVGAGLSPSFLPTFLLGAASSAFPFASFLPLFLFALLLAFLSLVSSSPSAFSRPLLLALTSPGASVPAVDSASSPTSSMATAGALGAAFGSPTLSACGFGVNSKWDSASSLAAMDLYRVQHASCFLLCLSSTSDRPLACMNSDSYTSARPLVAFLSSSSSPSSVLASAEASGNTAGITSSNLPSTILVLMISSSSSAISWVGSIGGSDECWKSRSTSRRLFSGLWLAFTSPLMDQWASAMLASSRRLILLSILSARTSCLDFFSPSPESSSSGPTPAAGSATPPTVAKSSCSSSSSSPTSSANLTDFLLPPALFAK